MLQAPPIREVDGIGIGNSVGVRPTPTDRDRIDR
jgi:hypothetical protein